MRLGALRKSNCLFLRHEDPDRHEFEPGLGSFLGRSWRASDSLVTDRSRSAPDKEIMAYASKNEFVVFTHDLDFGMLLATQASRTPSVLQIRYQDVLPRTIGGIVLHAIEAAYSHLQKGALVTVDPARHRIRLLPIDTGDV